MMLAATQPADMIVTGARIYTLDSTRPVVSGLAVRDGRIVYTGDDPSAFAGPQTKRIDARGAAIISGFIDSHAHVEGLGDQLNTLDLRPARSVTEVVERVRKAASVSPRGTWIRGRSWDQTRWGGKFPNGADLDAVAPEHPVYLVRVDGHAAWVNTRALQIARVTASTADPHGGKIHRDQSGKPTGILVDNAQDLVARHIPAPTLAETRQRLQAAARECARLGITSVHDAGVGEQTLAAYRDLIEAKSLPVRVYAMIGGPGPLWDRYRKRGPEIGERLAVRSIKLMADGALGSRGAAMLAPYADDPGNTGLLMLDRAEIEKIAREAVAAGFQVNTHAIGDRANRTVLQAYAAALGGKNDRRFRIEHAQVVAPEDFDLFAKYSVLPAMQATHATSDMRWVQNRLGDRVAGAYAWRKFLSRGLPVPNGSDFPVEEPDPIEGFYAAVSRQDRDGKPAGGWMPEQRMTREEALKSWTLDGAYAAFEESWKGRLAPGQAADFVILSADIMTVPIPEIRRARVLKTVVAGEVVYSGE